MQVQNIQSNNNQNFKAWVKPTWQLKELEMLYGNGENGKLLEKYIDILRKSPTDNYYEYVEEKGKPVIYSAKINEKFPIKFPYKLFKDPLELFRLVAGIEVGYSRAVPKEIYTKAEQDLVEPKMFILGQQ